MLDWLAHAAISHPEQVALRFGEQEWTYARLNTDVGRMAGYLAHRGVRAGQQVAILMPNRPAYVFAVHALARLGAVLVPLNTRLTTSELQWQVDQAQCSHLLFCDVTAEQAGLLALPGRGYQIPVEACAGFEGDVVAHSTLSLHQPQGIVFTSGTTGRPKGAVLTFGNHLASATASAFRLGTNAADQWLNCLPLFHLGGLSILFRCCLYGTTMVLHERFATQAVNAALDERPITLISLVPTMLQWLLEAREWRSFPSRLRCVLLGGAGTPHALLRGCLKQGIPIAPSYGLTETASQVVTATPAMVQRKFRNLDDLPPISSQAGAEAGHFVGKPLLFSSVRIVDEAGAEVPAGQIGEIVVQGPTVMQGYYCQPEATRRALRDGALFTGDLGFLDAEGDLWVVQRRSDLILSGGENVYPAEVEQVLLQHPAVKAACVVGVPDPVWGQRVAAAVALHAGATLTEEELSTFCQARLAGYKRPRLIRFVRELPRTSSGKVIRSAVAELFA